MTSARFSAWRSGPDTFGHTPDFFAVLPDGTRDMATYSGYGNATPPITRDAYWKTPHTIAMSQACGYPPRFPDLTRWSGGEPHARHLLVSERLYAVLRSFQLPDHRDYPVEARFPPHYHVRFGDQRATYRLVHWLGGQPPRCHACVAGRVR